MSPTYARATKVSVDQSRRELERILQRYGVEAFSYGHDADRAVVMFAAHERHVRLTMPVPDPADYAYTDTGLARSTSAREAAREALMRQRWRALLLIVKAKLEAVESGITTFEQEFLAHVVLPNQQTVGEWAAPALEDVYSSGEMPSLLPGVGALPERT